ncbi:hypothetical protein TNCV_4586491 [Trichonephila clavipes]|nr:hypothetical protein TNCV_4586491 [Trichonephila clavipes]
MAVYVKLESYKHYKATQELLATNLVILSHGRDESDTSSDIPSPTFHTTAREELRRGLQLFIMLSLSTHIIVHCKEQLPAPGNRSNERRYREKDLATREEKKGRNGREERG